MKDVREIALCAIYIYNYYFKNKTKDIRFKAQNLPLVKSNSRLCKCILMGCFYYCNKSEFVTVNSVTACFLLEGLTAL